MKPQRPYKRTDRVKEQIIEIITDTATKHIDIKQLGNDPRLTMIDSGAAVPVCPK